MDRLDKHIQAVLDLGPVDELDTWRDAREATMAALEIQAGYYKKYMQTLRSAKTLSDDLAAKILNFVGPWGAGAVCYSAVCVLSCGRIIDDYDDIAWRVRRRVQELQSKGRVKAKGEKRQRAPKPEPSGNLFCWSGLGAETA